jgi:prepilin-type N-terminal cleavage/methylation domain-containing protein
MQLLIRRLRDIRNSENGFSLVEVIVAMLIFALISTGIAYTMMSALQVTRDSRAKQVATNLAAQEIDLDRDSGNLFTLLNSTRTVTVNGDTFSVTRATQWVSSPDVNLACGAGAGTLKYKRVNVTVSWSNMRSGSIPVHADTIVSPNSQINDPNLGTILISVLSVSGIGMPGITLTATPSAVPGGAISPATGPVTTDAQGCAYFLKMTPGNYDVTVTAKPGYVDALTQSATPVVHTQAAAGTSTSQSFQYDNASTISVTYASNGPTGTIDFPYNLDTTYFPVSGATAPYFLTTLAGTTVNTTATRIVLLHPFPTGYTVVAGAYAAPGVAGATVFCSSVDPTLWPATTTENPQRVGSRSAVAATVPGGSASTNVRMGVATVKLTGTGTQYLKAVSATAPTGSADPGCAAPMTYRFGAVLTANVGAAIALPYGSWQLYYGSSSSQTTAVPASAITLTTRATLTGTVITFDPREPTP